MPERLTLARQQKLQHQDLLPQLSTSVRTC
jgi:hypothetical protein